MFLGQFRSPLIYLLFGASAVALALGETKDAIVIFAVVLLNALIGAYQEGRAEHALAALRQLSTQKARVVRASHEEIVDARALVPGDVLLLAAGDAVTADARLTDGAAPQIAEAALTGESVPVTKTTGVVAAESPLVDRANMVDAGTYVTAGRARAVVVATGTATEIGQIAALAEDRLLLAQKTPLERRVESFVLLAAVMLGYPPPFAAVQILWNNLVTEGVITVNLIMHPPEADEMRRPPISPTEPLLTAAMWTRIALMTPTIACVTLTCDRSPPEPSPGIRRLTGTGFQADARRARAISAPLAGRSSVLGARRSLRPLIAQRRNCGDACRGRADISLANGDMENKLESAWGPFHAHLSSARSRSRAVQTTPGAHSPPAIR